MADVQPITAYIALGANLGDRADTVRRALAMLATGSSGDHARPLDGRGRPPYGSDDIKVVRVSSLIETPAEGSGPDAPPYLNGAAEVRTALSAQELLLRLMDVESQLGRVRRVRWESRPIDLDILLYGDQVIDTPDLAVPHPRMHERLFVLRPLAEIAPDAIHPVAKVTIHELLERLSPR